MKYYMSPRTAYTIVALIGFLLGVFLYLLATIFIPYLIDTLPLLAEIFSRYRHILGALVSGFIGSIVAVLIAYLWASKSEF